MLVDGFGGVEPRTSQWDCIPYADRSAVGEFDLVDNAVADRASSLHMIATNFDRDSGRPLSGTRRTSREERRTDVFGGRKNRMGLDISHDKDSGYGCYPHCNGHHCRDPAGHHLTHKLRWISFLSQSLE